MTTRIQPLRKEDHMKPLLALTMVGVLIVPSLVLRASIATAACTVQERIALGNQGYEKAQVDEVCNSTGDDFWDVLSRGVATGLAQTLTNEVHEALGQRPKDSTAPSHSQSASACVTAVGTCPLSGGPVGSTCYCQAWNGATFTGLSR